jgi:putative photosynthetic complex assembly protein
MPSPLPRRGWARGPLALVGGFTAVAVLAVLAGPYMHPVTSHGASQPVAMRELRFVDRADGGVGVINAADGSTVEVIPAGGQSFVRATMRGLAQERLRDGVSPELPFRLTAWADDRLTLLDPGTGRAIEMESFGPTNEADFSRMLKLPGVAR